MCIYTESKEGWVQFQTILRDGEEVPHYLGSSLSSVIAACGVNFMLLRKAVRGEKKSSYWGEVKKGRDTIENENMWK